MLTCPAGKQSEVPILTTALYLEDVILSEAKSQPQGLKPTLLFHTLHQIPPANSWAALSVAVANTACHSCTKGEHRLIPPGVRKQREFKLEKKRRGKRKHQQNYSSVLCEKTKKAGLLKDFRQLISELVFFFPW